MSKTWKVTLPSGEINFVSSKDDQTPADVGYDETCTWEDLGRPSTAGDSIAASVEFDAGKALEWARCEIERKTAESFSSKIPDIRRHIMIISAWEEVQRLKMAMHIETVLPGTVPTDLEEQRDQYPFIMALVHLTSLTPLEVAQAIQDRYRGRMRDIVLMDAQMLLAQDAAAEASTPEEMIEIARDLGIA